MVLEATSPRRAGFFDAFPRFFDTSDTAPAASRLNSRYRALVERSSHLLEEAAVLDLASHDGRWSFAALHSGARYVVGLEGQSVLVEEAETTFQAYGVQRERYKFVCGDLFESVKDLEAGVFDVVFCFGFLHMHNRHHEMLREIERLAPRYLILDVWVLPFTNDPVTYLIPHRVDSRGSARYTSDFDYPVGLVALGYGPADNEEESSVKDGAAIKFDGRPSDRSSPEVMLIAFPSKAGLEWLLAEAGFGDLDYYNWNDIPVDSSGYLADYRSGQRLSVTARNLRYRG
jgi:Methyltransferase domain